MDILKGGVNMTNLCKSIIITAINIAVKKVIRKEGKRDAPIFIREDDDQTSSQLISQEPQPIDQVKVEENKEGNFVEEENLREETMNIFKNTFKDEVYENFIKKNKERLKSNDIECIYTFRQMQKYLLEKEDFGLLFNHFYKVVDVMSDEKNYNEDIIDFINSKIEKAYDVFSEKYPDVNIDVPDINWILNNIEGFTFKDEPIN